MVFAGGGYQTMEDVSDSSNNSEDSPLPLPPTTTQEDEEEDVVYVEEEIVMPQDEKSYDEVEIIDDDDEEEDTMRSRTGLRTNDIVSMESGEYVNSTSGRQVAPAPPQDGPPPSILREPSGSAVGAGSSSGVKSKLDQAEEATEDKCLSSIRGLVCIGVLLFVSLAAIVVGTGLGVAKPFEDDPPTEMVPTAAPSFAFPTFAPVMPSPEDEELLELWQGVVGNQVNETGTPYFEAAQWMLYRDPTRVTRRYRSLQGTEEDEDYTNEELDYIQRYLLTFLWFATTNNGRGPLWESCNPVPPEYTTEECDYAKAIRKLPNGQIQFEPIPWNRWLSSADECDWAGVTCSTNDQGRLTVTAIDLGGQGLEAPIEYIMELVKLPDLASLKLPWNTIRGNMMPDEISQLKELDLTDNFLQGPLLAVSGLTNLNLEGNFLTGNLPVELFEFDTPLQQLNLGRNLLGGGIPIEASFALQLTSLQLHENRLDGTIPPEIGQLPLQSLKLNGNALRGPLPLDPINIQWLSSVEELWLFENQFTGSIPLVIGSASRLADLRLSNNALTGGIPAELYNLNRLFRLELANNNLSGGLSISLVSQLTDLEVLDLSRNNFAGRILADSRLANLQSLKLEFNQFVGNVPSSLCSIDSLETLVADCAPEGTAPNPCSCCSACCNRATGVCTGGDGSPISSPTPPPAPAPSASATNLVQAWARQTFGNDIDQSSGSPHSLTSIWITTADSLSILPNEDPVVFLQRYTLAHFYFSTRTWLSCNAAPTNSCLYSRFVGVAADGSLNYERVPETRFLAGTSECNWVGVECDVSGTVIGLDLPGQEMQGSLPSELSVLGLERINLSYNTLTGDIPAEFESFVPELDSLQLQGNDIQGAMPGAFCSSTDSAASVLTTLEADCDQVFCPCCTRCF